MTNNASEGELLPDEAVCPMCNGKKTNGSWTQGTNSGKMTCVQCKGTGRMTNDASRARFWACHCKPGTSIKWYGDTAICTTCGNTNKSNGLSRDEVERLVEIGEDYLINNIEYDSQRKEKIDFIQDIKKRLGL